MSSAPASPGDEHWNVDFATRGDIGGFVRLSRVGDRCWYWAYVVGADIGLVAVRDHDVGPPRQARLLEVRADALWAELVCETADEHWGIALEAFGVRLDAPRESWEGEVGDRVAVGLDLEWEVDAAGPPFGSVHGDVLLERDRAAIDGVGVLRHAVAPDTVWPTDWSGWCRFDDGRWCAVTGAPDRTDPAGILVPDLGRLDDGTAVRFEPSAVVPVPLVPEATGRAPALVRVLTGVVPTGGDGTMTGIGWVEVLQSRDLRGARNHD